MSRENVEVVRLVWDAVERRDNQALFALYDPAIVWDTRRVEQIESGLYHGHEGVRRFFRAWLDSFEKFHTQAETFIEAGDKVLVGYRISGRGKGSGVDVDMARWNVYGVRNGLVTRVEAFKTKAEALEAVGLRE